MLSVPPLSLPAASAAACEPKEWLDHRATDLLPAGAFGSLVTLGGLRIDPWRSLEAEERAGSADSRGRRWGEWSSDRFAQPAYVGSAWTGSRELTGRGLVLVSSFLSTTGDSAARDERWSDWRPAAPTRFAVEHGSRGGEPVGPFGADCERSRLLAPAGYRYEPGDSPNGAPPSVRAARTEWFPVRDVPDYSSDELTPPEFDGERSGGPLRPWRTATGMPPSRPDLNGEAGTGVEPGAALGLGPERPWDPGRASLADRHAYPGNRIDWNGHGRVAVSGLCLESKGRGPC